MQESQALSLDQAEPQANSAAEQQPTRPAHLWRKGAKSPNPAGRPRGMKRWKPAWTDAERFESELKQALGDPLRYAALTMVRLMLGSEGDRTGDVARRAAEAILDGKLWEVLADEQLGAHADRVLAELERRGNKRRRGQGGGGVPPEKDPDEG